MTQTQTPQLKTPFTELFKISTPIIGGPMFLVSDENLVSAISQAGALGGMPSLNWRSSEEFRKAIQAVKSKTQKPFAVNLIVNQINVRLAPDLEICCEEKVPLVITSLGNPKEVIQKVHAIGGKVFCDVTDLHYAQKVQDLGADGVIAVSSGAGGHAGPISPFVLVPYLKKHLKIPVVLAGSISVGSQMAAALVLGADAVQIGTRFIASHEAKVDPAYKQAILKAEPEDIVLTKKISGTPLSVINTPYVEKMGTELTWIEEKLLKNPKTKKYMKMVRAYLGSEKLKTAILGPTYKEVWCAGQGVGLIDEILSASEIVDRLTEECHQALNNIKQ